MEVFFALYRYFILPDLFVVLLVGVWDKRSSYYYQKREKQHKIKRVLIDIAIYCDHKNKFFPSFMVLPQKQPTGWTKNLTFFVCYNQFLFKSFEQKMDKTSITFSVTLLYELPSNPKGKNFVSKIHCYCPQNTMEIICRR